MYVPTHFLHKIRTRSPGSPGAADRSADGDIRIIEFQKIPISIPQLRHGFGPILAHAHIVAVSRACVDKITEALPPRSVLMVPLPEITETPSKEANCPVPLT